MAYSGHGSIEIRFRGLGLHLGVEIRCKRSARGGLQPTGEGVGAVGSWLDVFEEWIGGATEGLLGFAAGRGRGSKETRSAAGVRS